LRPRGERLLQDNPFLLRNKFGVGWLLPFSVFLTSGATGELTLQPFTVPASGPPSPFLPHTDTFCRYPFTCRILTSPGKCVYPYNYVFLREAALFLSGKRAWTKNDKIWPY
jgi:hypothetical protein